jgi:hypothetical protein
MRSRTVPMSQPQQLSTTITGRLPYCILRHTLRILHGPRRERLLVTFYNSRRSRTVPVSQPQQLSTTITGRLLHCIFRLTLLILDGPRRKHDGLIFACVAQRWLRYCCILTKLLPRNWFSRRCRATEYMSHSWRSASLAQAVMFAGGDSHETRYVVTNRGP